MIEIFIKLKAIFLDGKIIHHFLLQNIISSIFYITKYILSWFRFLRFMPYDLFIVYTKTFKLFYNIFYHNKIKQDAIFHYKEQIYFALTFAHFSLPYNFIIDDNAIQYDSAYLQNVKMVNKMVIPHLKIVYDIKNKKYIELTINYKSYPDDKLSYYGKLFKYMLVANILMVNIFLIYTLYCETYVEDFQYLSYKWISKDNPIYKYILRGLLVKSLNNSSMWNIITRKPLCYNLNYIYMVDSIYIENLHFNMKRRYGDPSNYIMLYEEMFKKFNLDQYCEMINVNRKLVERIVSLMTPKDITEAVSMTCDLYENYWLTTTSTLILISTSTSISF